MSIINKIKTTAKCLINQIPLADLRSILAPRGVLIFENERESHLHTLSQLHGALRRDFFSDDVTRWREDFGHRGEAIRYLSNTNSSRSWSFDVYSAASVTLLRDLYVPGEEPPPVQLPELDDSVKSWNAQHGTEFVLIDESELSELQDQAAAWNRRELELESDIESITNDATEADGEIRDLKEKLELEIRLRVEDAEEYNDMRDRAQELEDRAQELQGELDEWHSLGSGYGLNLDVDDVGERLDTLTEWEPVIDLGMEPCEIQEQLEAAEDWKQIGDDTGLTPCEISQELDRLQEVDAALEQAKNKLSSDHSKAIEIGLIWRSLEIALDC